MTIAALEPELGSLPAVTAPLTLLRPRAPGLAGILDNLPGFGDPQIRQTGHLTAAQEGPTMASPTTPDAPPRRLSPWPAGLAGLLAMLALMGLQEALNSLNQAFISAPSAAAQTIVRLTPGAITNTMIETLGKGAIQLLTASAYVGTALIGLALGLGAAWLRGSGRSRWATGLLVGAPLVLYLLVAPAQARGAGALALALVVGAMLAAIYAGLTLLLWRGFQPAAFVPAGPTGAVVDPQRRAIVGGGLAAVALLAGGGALIRQVTQSPATTEALTPLEPLATPTGAPAAAANAPAEPTKLAAHAPTTAPAAAAAPSRPRRTAAAEATATAAAPTTGPSAPSSRKTNTSPPSAASPPR